MSITLNTTCWTIQDGAIVQGTLDDFSHFIETTTRPTGVGTKYYTTTISRRNESDTDYDGNEVAPAEEFSDVWVVAKWMTWGGPEHVISEHDSEAEAIQAVEAFYVSDILHNNELAIYLNRQQAEVDLADMAD